MGPLELPANIFIAPIMREVPKPKAAVSSAT